MEPDGCRLKARGSKCRWGQGARQRPRPRPGDGRHRRPSAPGTPPRPVIRPWFALSLLTAFGLLLAAWFVSTRAQPDPSFGSCPGVNAPVRDQGLHPHPVPQQPRARPPRDGLRGRLHRGQLAPAVSAATAAASPQGPRARRPARDRVRRRARRLLARHAGLRRSATALSTLAAQFGMPQWKLLLVPPPPRRARADRALPPARRVGDREPPRPLGGAAGRDVRRRWRSPCRCYWRRAAVELWISPRADHLARRAAGSTVREAAGTGPRRGRPRSGALELPPVLLANRLLLALLLRLRRRSSSRRRR